MSAIVGFFGFDGRPASSGDLERMVSKLAHRGPDGNSIWFEDSIGLGNCMLHTTPESLNEHLPFARDGLVITADARVDNREVLIANLGFNKYSEENITDSEIILEAYRKWGKDCPAKILGDFAFAIWNKNKQELFCARDHFGIKPFYYYQAPGKFFAFASEIKALFCLSDVPSQLNEVRIGDFLATFPEDTSSTFYKGILRLPPAHCFSVSSKNLFFHEYWQLEPNYELQLGSDQEYAEAYLDVFSQAVRCRLRSAFPLGSTLSGGLDSSSIVCLARAQLMETGMQPLKTFSGIFDNVPESDERPYINSVIEQGNIEPHFVHVDQISPLVELERVLWHQEEPIWTPNLFMHWGLYDSAQKQGVRVFLDGFLGDNIVFHGWEHLIDLAYSWRWVALYRQIRGVVEHKSIGSQRQVMWRYFWEISLKQRLFRKIKKSWYHTKQPQNMQISTSNFSDIMNSDFAHRINHFQHCQKLRRPDAAPPYAAKKRHYADLRAGEIPLGLEVSNKISQAFSLEVRYPFTDRRLAEFCLAIPSRLRVSDGRSRMIMRWALKKHLPSKVFWRSDKGDLSYNLKKGLLNFEEQRMDEIILHDSAIIETYINMATLRKNYNLYKNNYRKGNFQAIWSSVNLAAWLKQTSIALNSAC